MPRQRKRQIKRTFRLPKRRRYRIFTPSSVRQGRPKDPNLKRRAALKT